nr:FG-GAP-like repeat-containing protein [Sessilibacter corallicola]
MTVIYKNKLIIGVLALSVSVSAETESQVSYLKLNTINSGGFDDSLFLGGRNAARTSDAEVGDINRDGFPDILDGNSLNLTNGTNLLIRMNNGDGSGFTAQTIFADDVASFDVHLADLNNDGYDDLIRSASFVGEGNSVSVYLNLTESPWLSLNVPRDAELTDGCVSDIDVADVNNDGFLDIGIAQSTLFPCESSVTNTGQANILLNDGTGRFDSSIPAFIAQDGVSSHDVFFLDADHDKNIDLIVVNENGDSVLYLNGGGEVPNFVATDLVLPAGITGNAVDVNADGFVDFVIGGESGISVFLNNAVSPGTFTQLPELVNLSNGNVFDVELADVDIDGDVDILSVNNLFGEPVVWANDGALVPTFTGISDPFPADFYPEGVSAELIDYDLDGDNDIYIAGGEFDMLLGCLGCSVNQFYRTDAFPQLLYTNFELETGVWFQSTEDTHDWRFRWDRTSSLNTGPDRASSGRYYYYLETTDGNAFDAGNTAILESPTLPFGDNRFLVFDYHMHGEDIGSLHVDVFDGVQWVDSVWSIEGQQQLDETNPWLTARVNLSEFSGEIKTRIRAVAAGGFRGDIAIDNLNVTNEPLIVPETIDTNFIVDFPVNDGIGELVAVVDGQRISICRLFENNRCEFTLAATPDSTIDLVIDVSELPAELLPGLFASWEGCDETVGSLTCQVQADGFTRSLTHFQALFF